MIDPLEPTTRVIVCAGDGAAIPGGLLTFTADGDMTLRQVLMSGGILSVDPSFTTLKLEAPFDEFRIDSAVGINNFLQVNNLVYPMTKGSTLYWGNWPGAACQLILVFT